MSPWVPSTVPVRLTPGRALPSSQRAEYVLEREVGGLTLPGLA